jgi:hypothetical protein
VLTCELRLPVLVSRRTVAEVESDLHSETEFDTSVVPLSDGTSWMALRAVVSPMAVRGACTSGQLLQMKSTKKYRELTLTGLMLEVSMRVE